MMKDDSEVNESRAAREDLGSSYKILVRISRGNETIAGGKLILPSFVNDWVMGN